MRKIWTAILLILLGHGSAKADPVSPHDSAPMPAAATTPPIDDLLLEPVPPPRRVLSTWREAVAYQRAQSTDLRIAVDLIKKAEAQTRVALAQYLPSLSATGTWTHQFLTRDNETSVPVVTGGELVTSSRVPVPDVYRGRVVLDQTIFNVSLFDQVGLSKLRENASRLSAEDRERVLVLGMASQIVAVVAAERSAEINRAGFKASLDQVEMTKHSNELGTTTVLDVVRALQNAADARAMLLAGDEVLHQTRESLGAMLGFSEEAGVAPKMKINGIVEDVLTSCRKVASIDDRPDLAAARANLEVAKRGLRNAWYGFLPTVGARATLGASSLVPIGYPTPTFSVEGLLSIPIWDGGARAGNIVGLRADQDVAAQQLNALQMQGTIQVEQVKRQLVVAEKAHAVARDQRDLAARSDELTRAGYVAGQGTSFELVIASQAHRIAELNLVLREYGVIKARLAAALALATCYP